MGDQIRVCPVPPLTTVSCLVFSRQHNVLDFQRIYLNESSFCLQQNVLFNSRELYVPSVDSINFISNFELKKLNNIKSFLSRVRVILKPN